MTETRDGLPILAFETGKAFEAWLESQPSTSRGLWLKFAKAGSARASLSKSEAVDLALCHGWIDGRLDPYDDANWLVRFTPRKRGSQWSERNRKRATDLIESGRMRPPGLAQVEAARADGRWEAAYAPARSAETPPDLEAALAASPKAAAFFATLRGANRYAVIYRVHTAKKPETRAKRIAAYIAMLERGETLH